MFSFEVHLRLYALELRLMEACMQLPLKSQSLLALAFRLFLLHIGG